MMISMGFLQDTPLETRSADVKCAGARPTLGETGGKLRVSARGVRHDVKSVKAFAAEWVSRGSDHADAAQCRFYYLVKQLNRSRQMPPRPRKSRRDASYASLRELCDAAKPVLVQAGMPSLSSRINVSSRRNCTAQEAAAVLDITQYAAATTRVHHLL